MMHAHNRLFVCGAVVLGLACALGQGRVDILAQTSHDVTAEMIEQWMTELSNWGRWGDDDQLGALNLITPEKRKQSVALVREGISVSMSHNYIKEQAADAPRVFEHEMLGSGQGLWASDRYSIAYHGYTHSHMDSLCHMAIDGVMYNGFTRAEHVSEAGFCGKLAILDAKQGIMTKGVLMDIPRLKGVDYLELGTKIYVEDLEAWERQAGVRVEPGDVMFVRSGRWARRAAVGPWATSEQAAALHVSVAPWLKERDVAMIGSDHTSDALPSGVEGVREPVHQMMLVAMGVRIFDNLDLEAVAEEAARQNRWEFLLTAAPLAVTGGTGSPLNPIATF